MTSVCARCPSTRSPPLRWLTRIAVEAQHTWSACHQAEPPRTPVDVGDPGLSTQPPGILGGSPQRSWRVLACDLRLGPMTPPRMSVEAKVGVSGGSALFKPNPLSRHPPMNWADAPGSGSLRTTQDTVHTGDSPVGTCVRMLSVHVSRMSVLRCHFVLLCAF